MDFRSYLKDKGETELAKQIPNTQRGSISEAPASHHSEAVENGCGLCSGNRNTQGNALQHWTTHMAHRRRQQSFLSDLLDRPVENLLMNQAYRFRETQEQREFLNRVMPLIDSGYGCRVGSEFWSLPQHYGDEVTGITATLTQTEQGRQKPVTRIAQPRSIRQESGISCAESVRPASRTWAQSAYPQQRCQELEEVLREMDIKKPDIDGLEVIGSTKPSTFVTVCRSPLLEKEEGENEYKEMERDIFDQLAHCDDVRSDTLLIPALRFCGQLATWTGNAIAKQGEVGISSTIIFEALTGERVSSHLELHNEGSTAIFYSWQQLLLPRSFPNLQSKTKSLSFYLNCSSGVILPGDTQQVEFIFKSEKPGIKTELWQLNTHPVLMQGAPMQLTLRGVALYQDKTADQRLFLETKLEKKVTVKICQSIVNEVLQGVQTPERASSPAELYIAEEQGFLRKNPKLQYLNQPVEDLKRLWQEINPGCSWDLSIDTLRQIVLSLPESTQEIKLAELNSLVLQLSEPSDPKHHLTATDIGQQLWRRQLDKMVVEAILLRNLLGLPDTDTWADEMDESKTPDADVADDKDGQTEIKEGAGDEEKGSGVKSRSMDVNKGEAKLATTKKSLEVGRNKDSRKKEKRQEEAVRCTNVKWGHVSASPAGTHPEGDRQPSPDGQNVDQEVISMYRRLLRKKVYSLIEDLVDNLCELMEELNEGPEQDIHNINI